MSSGSAPNIAFGSGGWTYEGYPGKEWQSYHAETCTTLHWFILNGKEEIASLTNMSRLVRKPTKWLCAQRRLRSAWASAQSDQSLRCALNAFLHADSEDLGQTGRMPRLIIVFAGRTCHFVDFLVTWLIFLSTCSSFAREGGGVWEWGATRKRRLVDLLGRRKIADFPFMLAQYTFRYPPNVWCTSSAVKAPGDPRNLNWNTSVTVQWCMMFYWYPVHTYCEKRRCHPTQRHR